MRAAPGTYALVFASHVTRCVDVGALGRITLAPGYYVYVGSAFGPGGVKARVARHWRRDKRRHWHIDYLTPWLEPQSVWFLHAATREEHRWASALMAMTEFAPVPRFGASDCRCVSHFGYCETAPRARVFERIGAAGIRYQAAPS